MELPADTNAEAAKAAASYKSAVKAPPSASAANPVSRIVSGAEKAMQNSTDEEDMAHFRVMSARSRITAFKDMFTRRLSMRVVKPLNDEFMKAMKKQLRGVKEDLKRARHAVESLPTQADVNKQRPKYYLATVLKSCSGEFNDLSAMIKSAKAEVSAATAGHG